MQEPWTSLSRGPRTWFTYVYVWLSLPGSMSRWSWNQWRPPFSLKYNILHNLHHIFIRIRQNLWYKSTFVLCLSFIGSCNPKSLGVAWKTNLRPPTYSTQTNPLTTVTHQTNLFHDKEPQRQTYPTEHLPKQNKPITPWQTHHSDKPSPRQ